MAGFIDFATLATLADPEEAKRPDSPQAAVFAHLRNPELSDAIEAANQANLSFMPLLSGDEGTPMVIAHPDSPAAAALRAIADKVIAALG